MSVAILLFSVNLFYISFSYAFDSISNEMRICQESLYTFKLKGYILERVIDVPSGLNVSLECNFCEDTDNYQGKVWYFKRRGFNESFKEVTTEIGGDVYFSKFKVTISHALHIRNFNVNNSGVYTCCYYGHEGESLFTYILDCVFPSKTVPLIGESWKWKRYKYDVLDPINVKFENAEEEPFSLFRESISFRTLSCWENWGSCEPVNGRLKGIRKKLGKCCLHSFPAPNIKGNSKNGIRNKIRYFDFFDQHDIFCRSLQLRYHFPKLSKVVERVPDFIFSEVCRVHKSSFQTTTSSTLQLNSKDEKLSLIKIAEGSHKTLVCPDVAHEIEVIWYKDGSLLDSSYRNNMAESETEPHITIDNYNSLYILQATKSEEGVYACYLNGVKMKDFDIKVLSKDKILNQDFIRYSIYLGFVLSLTISCYCGGVCVAWHQRSSFADPSKVYSKTKLHYRRLNNIN